MGDNYEPLDSPLMNGGAPPPPPPTGMMPPPPPIPSPGDVPPPPPPSADDGGAAPNSLMPDKSPSDHADNETFQSTMNKTVQPTKVTKKKSKDSQAATNPKKKTCIIISVVCMFICLVGLGASSYFLLTGLKMI